LKKRISEGTFREDLFFRLNVIAVSMPPLRTLAADLDRFAEHYTRHFARQCARPLEGLSEDAVAAIHAYSWPGNLRELRNAIERAVVLSREAKLQREDFPAEVRLAALGGNSPGDMPVQIGLPITLEKLEEAHVRKVLAQTSSLLDAAAILGIDQATLYRKRKKLGLE
jgi:NtrC-family two-component system response regulator AlgB